MKKIAVFTSARSEYGLLKNVIRQLMSKFKVDLLVAGAHFSYSKGYSYSEIVKDHIVDFDNIIEIEFLLDTTTSQGLSKSVGLAQISIAQILQKKKYDGIVILGDRYELFGISVPALLFNIPLFHISGGEITEGVLDESVRHSHTKLSHVHFVANNGFAENVSRMGEENWRICIVGECGLDNIYNLDCASKEEVLKQFKIDIDKEIFLITFHPSTLEYKYSLSKQVDSLLNALDGFEGYQKIFTAPGVEKGSNIIIEKIKEFTKKHRNSIFVENLGSRNYLTILKNSQVVIGNSSSGIVEAPSFGIPTINIGDRQKNRISAKSVINCGCETDEIKNGIKKAISKTFRDSCSNIYNPYDPYKDGRNSERIAFSIQQALKLSKEKLMIKKFDTDVKKGEWNYLLHDFL
ncbi:UDP-N-acetylglucosamine 2-epimerase (hydrolyzing) [Lutibacter sp. B2]|nr:UDP-N-acetylglucosamine 2-epimerase (hydrolyzing) [Lutibacter sp. B2]